MSATSLPFEIAAPLAGLIVPLDLVPDPVFAQKIVGDGISIDPTSGDLLAPMAGEVVQLHGAHHALTLRADNGVELLIHVGIDTVMLRGEGFMPLVRVGERVERGQPLLRFDVDALAAQARSLLTQIVVANMDAVAAIECCRGVVAAGAPLMRITLAAPAAAHAAAASVSESASGDAIVLPNAQGLHARPAAVLAAAAKRYKSEIRLVRGADEANAKSVVALMGLATRQGQDVHLAATGPDAAEAVAALTRLIVQGCGEAADAAHAPSVAAPAPVAAPPAAAAAVPDDGQLRGVSAAPGLAVGSVVQLRELAIEVHEQGENPARERGRIEAAIHEARAQIESLIDPHAKTARAEILAAHVELLDDPDLLDQAIAGTSRGQSAAWAWREAYNGFARRLEGLDNALLRERASDIRDIGRRVLALLAGVQTSRLDIPAGSILIAEELSPSETAQLDRSKVLGFATTGGGATSHVAILARSLGIPAVCGIAEAALEIPEGTRVVLDGTRGLLHGNPSAEDLAAARARLARQAARRAEEASGAGAPAVTRDGHRIEVVANVTNAAEAADAVQHGAEGVGLLRSEFLFEDRDSAPTEAEQAAAYEAVAHALGRERTLVIRTLDVGGDKPLAYLPLPREDNPFLGLRGIRVGLDRPEMLRAQLRAILRAAPHGKLHIMFPMIASVDEFIAAKAIALEAMTETGQQAKVGAMIEVPSAALLADVIAREADFFSIGSNDLTQYTLAMDRGHPKLARQADALHPAVLKMMALTVEGAHRHGRWVGVCGGIASDTLAVPLLIGLGVDELSVSVPAIAAVKAAVKRVARSDCEALAREVLAMGTAQEVRARLSALAE
ncbi:MAG: phosphoenolpyruvate--protein phosphotransferase [Burkholderiales bacterium]|nr:phosphoenolpyruvate--protein phosphotransferase [Burkholderiales bacterium]